MDLIMKTSIVVITIIISCLTTSFAQNHTTKYKKHEMVWTGGVFKSWLLDEHVGFNKIGGKVSPVFKDEKKSGFMIQSHYMYKPFRLVGFGGHIGLGLDVNSYIQAPVLLFGLSISVGKNNDFIIDIGWADAKRKIVPNSVKKELLAQNYSEVPEIFNHTEFNTAFYVGLGYRLF